MTLFFCLFLFLPALAGPFPTRTYICIFTGRVQNSFTRRVIPNAQVIVANSQGTILASNLTNAQGRYTLTISYSRERISLRAQAQGYQTQTRVTSSIIRPRTYTLNFLLRPQDTLAPTGSLQINQDTPYTSTPQVTLNLLAQDNPGGSGLSQMRFSQDNRSWSPAETFSETKPWNLSLGDGEKRVYVKFRDNSGNWSRPFSDTIILDTTPPEVIITSPQDSQVLEDEPVITLRGTIDAQAFSEERTLEPGLNTLTKEARDAAGNTAFASVTVNYLPGTLISEEGGEVSSTDGKVRLVIPARSLSQPTRIKLVNLNQINLSDSAPSGKTLLSVVECRPANLSFAHPVSIIYTLSQAEIPGTPIELGLYDASHNRITPTGQVSTVPVDSYTVTFSITHFSTYAALRDLNPQTAPIGLGVKIPLPDMLTGSFSHSLPITSPPGRRGMQPSLALTYRSANPNSWVGVGFSLNPGYIVRSTRLGPPTYNDTQDTFYLITDSGASELVHLIDNLYQAKVESSFTKFFKERDDSWKALAKDGSVLRFGQTSDSKETSSSGTFSWYITKAQDPNGNYLDYHYTKDSGKAYLLRLDYTGHTSGLGPSQSIEFFLENREDISSSYISTSRIATTKRLREIQIKINSDLVWRYVLEYDYSPDTHRSLLRSVTQSGSDAQSLPVQRFGYQEAR